MNIRYRFTGRFAGRFAGAVLLLMLSVLQPELRAQYTPISGVVNSYVQVTHVDRCNSIISVLDAGGFAPGDMVVIIQMTGAAVEPFTGSGRIFGTVKDYGLAGRYEFAVIDSISNNRIRVRNSLIQSYDYSWLVQLVRVPRYRNARVEGVLTAAQWNGITGGVLAIDVADTLRLDADIDVTGRGFRGGIASNTAIVDQRGFKGEGIAHFPLQYTTGRDPLANGGGGGGSSNAGGAGGANIGGGGRGGSAIGSADFGGLGGHPLDYSMGSVRVFMGGGGGGGHQDNETGTTGGNGGGIILIRARVVTSRGGHIRANGDVPPVAGMDGAGGGGGGGGVLIQAESLQAPLRIEAKGGQGGGLNDYLHGECLGPGGGGGGGVIWLSTLKIPARVVTDVTGGAGGRIMTPGPCFNTSSGAGTGSPGAVLGGLHIPQSDHEPGHVAADAGRNRSICRGERTQLVATGGLSYKWNDSPSLNCSHCPNPTVRPDSTTTYYVTVSDHGGCVGVDSVTISVVPCGDVALERTHFDCYEADILATDSVFAINTIELDSSESANVHIERVEGLSSKEVRIVVGLGERRYPGHLKLHAINARGARSTIIDTLPGRGANALRVVGVEQDYFDIDTTTVGTNRCGMLGLRNDGNADVIIPSAACAGNTSFSIPPSQFPLVIPPGATREIEVCFEAREGGQGGDTLLIHGLCPIHISLSSYGLFVAEGETCNTAIGIRAAGEGTSKVVIDVPRPNPGSAMVEVPVDIYGDRSTAITGIPLVRDRFGDPVGTPEYTTISAKGSGNAYHEQGIFRLDLTELPQGLYWLTIPTPEGAVTQPITVLR